MKLIGTYLYLLFEDNDNNQLPFLFMEVDYNASENDLKNLAQAIIDNGSIFTYEPQTIKNAKLSKLTTKDVNI